MPMSQLHTNRAELTQRGTGRLLDGPVSVKAVMVVAVAVIFHFTINYYV